MDVLAHLRYLIDLFDRASGAVAGGTPERGGNLATHGVEALDRFLAAGAGTTGLQAGDPVQLRAISLLESARAEADKVPLLLKPDRYGFVEEAEQFRARRALGDAADKVFVAAGMLLP